MQCFVSWYLIMTSWEKRKMVINMLFNFVIISYPVPSIKLVIDIDKVCHCALVGVQSKF